MPFLALIRSQDTIYLTNEQGQLPLHARLSLLSNGGQRGLAFAQDGADSLPLRCIKVQPMIQPTGHSLEGESGVLYGPLNLVTDDQESHETPTEKTSAEDGQVQDNRYPATPNRRGRQAGHRSVRAVHRPHHTLKGTIQLNQGSLKADAAK